jgi:hypothetical protein
MMANPERHDDVDRWIKRYRDNWERWGGRTAEWYALDDLLDDYRRHADTGTPLDQDVSETQQNLVERM